MALRDTLVRKAGPLKVWQWAALGGLVGTWYLVRRRQLAAGAAPSSTGAGLGAAGTIPGGIGSQFPSGFPFPPMTPGGTTVDSTPPPVRTTFASKLLGSGFEPIFPRGSNPWTTPIPAGADTYYQVPGASLGAIYGTGQTVYYQPSPGTFVPVPSGTIPWLSGSVVAPDTPLFVSGLASAITAVPAPVPSPIAAATPTPPTTVRLPPVHSLPISPAPRFHPPPPPRFIPPPVPVPVTA